MENFKILLSASPWLILVCLAAGALYAWLLYNKKSPWSKKVNYALAALRFVVVSFLCFLLLGPYMRQITQTQEKPTIVFAVDNSQSVGLFTDSAQLNTLTSRLQEITQNLEKENITTQVRTFNTNQQQAGLNQIQFTQQSTNLDQLLNQVRDEFENRNLAGVVLLSDGIINQGMSPVHANYTFPILPLAVGDTVPKRDLNLATLFYNKVAYSGNRFPVVAEIRNEGFGPATATVLLKEGSKVLARKQIQLAQDKKEQRVEFLLTAESPGKKHYQVELQPLEGEFTTLNNSKNAYIDIVKGRIKVLIAAAAPHPDIKAIRAAIETNDNFETKLFIPGIENFKPDKYDLAVLHQLPNRSRSGQDILKFVQDKNVPALYVIGNQSDLNAFNQLNLGININRRGNQNDEVLPVLNPDFRRFTIAEDASEKFAKYPPATVPFADFQVSPNTEVLLRQQVGKVKTDKPLLVTQIQNERRHAVLVAEGSWQWRLTEAAYQENSQTFDKLIVSLTQLLTTKESKKRLNVYPTQDEYVVSDDIRFEAELYNDIYERTYGQKVNLRITNAEDSSRSFSFINGEGFSGINIGNLPGGVYRYTASATIDGKNYTDKGEFAVQELQLEALEAQADHNLLYQLARQSGANVYYPNQTEQLEQDLLQSDFKNVIYSSEQLKDLINLKWLFFVLLLLASMEWFLRKYNGSY